MTKSNNEWVPEVGEACEFRSVARVEGLEDFATDFEKCVPEFLSSCGAVVRDENDEQCFMDFMDYNVSFRQIKTEAEKRRESQISLIAKAVNHHLSENNDDVNGMSATLYEYGCRIPKPLTDEVINDIAWRILKETDYVDGIDKMVYVVRLVSKELRSKMIGAPE